jgi:hypothetical protein
LHEAHEAVEDVLVVVEELVPYDEGGFLEEIQAGGIPQPVVYETDRGRE